MTRRIDSLRAALAERGYVVTDADRDRARAGLAATPPIDDARHQRNLAWLTAFDTDTTAA